MVLCDFCIKKGKDLKSEDITATRLCNSVLCQIKWSYRWRVSSIDSRAVFQFGPRQRNT